MIELHFKLLELQKVKVMPSAVKWLTTASYCLLFFFKNEIKHSQIMSAFQVVKNDAIAFLTARRRHRSEKRHRLIFLTSNTYKS
jgi:hypothetical protein